MRRLSSTATELRQAYGDRACREALNRAWAARLAGDRDGSDLLLSAAIRLCRPTP